MDILWKACGNQKTCLYYKAHYTVGMNNHLLVFTGTECPHCDAMRPLFMKLMRDTGIQLEEKDTWASQADFRLMENYQEELDDPDCAGIPFFYNTKTKKHLCGEVSYKKLQEWAEG